MSGFDSTLYNKALFESMSHSVDAVWMIDLQTEQIYILYDRIEPSKIPQHLTLAQAQDFARKVNHPDDIERTVYHLSGAYLRTLKQTETHEARSFVHGHNQETTLEYTCTPEFNASGKIIRVFTTFRNIQKQVDTEHEKESLTQLLQIFQMAANATNTTVFIFDTKEQSILVNSTDADNWGITVEQKGVPYEMAYSSIVSPKYREKYINLHEKMMKGEDSAYGIVGLRDAEGSEGLYELTFSRIFDKDGNPTSRATGIYRNITEFTREARKSQAIANVLGNDYDLILLINTEDRTIQSHKLTGDIWQNLGLKDNEVYNYDEFIELWATKGSHKDDINIIRTKCTIENIVHEVDTNGQYTYTFRCINEGREQTLQCTHQRLTGTTEIISSYRNIDAIMAYENKQRQAIEDALAAAEQANRAKTTFLNNMSHDIRTPMNAIIGFTTLAANHADSKEKVLDYLEKINTSSNHLLSLINDVLDMSRIESGKVAIEESEVSLSQLMIDLKNIIQADIAAKQQQLVFAIDDIQTDTVWCDKLRLNQILLNCVSNSMKFTPTGGRIELVLKELHNAQKDFATYQFRIKDNGIGMNPEFLKHLFEPFERERTSTVSGITGTGLGMSITKNLIDMMNGSIDVTSQKGVGTESIITLTFKVAETQTEKTVPPEEMVTQGNCAVSERLKDIRILLVEDNPLNREIALDLLSETGAILDSAENGKEAVLRINNAKPGTYDIVLMDIQMPVMDGYEAARHIRTLDNPELASIPIIAMTANAFEDDRKKALESGMNDHIGKPINLDVIIKTILRVLQ